MSKKLKITILSDHDTWINFYIPSFISELEKTHHTISWIHKVDDIKKGDLCFLFSFSKILKKSHINRSKVTLVVHESKVPKGKGWSPLTWQIIEGANKIPITLLEVVEKVDSGKIFQQENMYFNGYELINELRSKQADYTFRLSRKFIKDYPKNLSEGKDQKGKSTFYQRRDKNSSELDIHKTILENFNLLRVVDNEKYPAFFKINGKKFKLIIKEY